MNLQKYFRRTRREYSEASRMMGDYLATEKCDSAGDQLRKAARIWEDAIRDVPYYRNLVSNRLAPQKIYSWDDFKEIPELTRSIVQRNRKDFVRLGSKPLLIRMTGGSTGHPMQFGVSSEEDKHLRLLKLMLWIRAGYTLDSRIFLLWGHTHLLGTGFRKHKNVFDRKFKDFLLGYTRVDAHHLDPDHCREYASKLIFSRADAVIGYTAALDHFARSVPEFRDRFHNLRLKFLMTCSEMAPRKDTYALLGDVFGCPLIQEYGGVDLGQIAMKYQDEPFKVFHHDNIVEPLNTSEGEASPILVTTIYQRYFPLIRYRAGDLLEGCTLNTMGNVISFQKLLGRENDVVVLPDGETLHSLSFLHCIREEKDVLQVQLSIDDNGLEIRLVVSTSYTDQAEKRIRLRLSKISKSLTEVRIRLEKDIMTTEAGKRSWLSDRRTKKSS